MLHSVRRVWRIVWKEALIAAGSHKMRVVLIAPPILQTIIFAFALSMDVQNVKIGVCNRDAGVEGAAFLKAFFVKPIFKEVVYYFSDDEIKTAIERREIFAAAIIPSDFSQKILSGDEAAEIQLLLDGRRANAAAILGGYVARIAQTYGAVVARERVDVRSTPASVSGLTVRRWFNPNLLSRQAFLPCLICLLATTVAMIVSALSIARERETGTFEQLLVAPESPFEIVLGKTISAVMLATCSTLLVTALVVWGFKIPLQGPFWLMFATMLLYLISVVSVGLMISAASATQQQATLGMFLFLPPAIMLSGFATPIENMPSWLQCVTIFNPVRWEMSLMRGLFLRDMSAGAIVPHVVPLVVVAILSFSASCYMFKRRME